MSFSGYKLHLSLHVCAFFRNSFDNLADYQGSVVKSRLQAGNTKYKSSLDGLLTILKEEGVEGLYKGIGSKIVQSVLTAAILFAGQRRIFEITKAVCGGPSLCPVETLNFLHQAVAPLVTRK